MGKYLEIARKLKEQKADSLDSFIELPEIAQSMPVEGGIDFVNLLTETERGHYFKLLEIMQSDKFGMDRETAEREAGKMITRKRSPLQERQAAEDYRRYGYVKIFSTVLERAVYLVRDQTASRRVPDKNIPVFLEGDLGAVKGLCPGTAKLLLEVRLIFGGPITVEDYTEPPSQRRMDGKQISRSIYSDERKVNHE